MDNTVQLQHDVRLAIEVVVFTVKRLLDADVNTVMIPVDSRPVTQTRLQLFYNLKWSNRVQSRVWEIVLTHAVAAEKLGPGAFDPTLRSIIENLECHLKGQQPSFILNNSCVTSRHSSETDLKRLITTYDVNSLTRSMLHTALHLAGYGGRIVVEKTHAQVSSVELVNGYNFTVNPGWPMSVRLESPRVFVIDGYIEQVSEVNHLLEAASETRESVVMFSRGLSDDVLHTLRINHDRGTLKVIPLVVPFDLDGINTVNDIAIASGANMVASNKGDLISSTRFVDAPRVDSALVYPTKVVIQETKTGHAVAAHVAELKKKRHSSNLVDVGELYDRRIRALSPNQVVIRLSDDKDFVRNSQAIDVMLRTFRSLVDHGTTDDGRSAIIKVATVVHVQKCLETLMSLGAVIISSDDAKQTP